MVKKTRRIYLEIQTSRKSPVGLLRTSYYENGTTKHTQHGKITGKTLEELKLIQMALRGNVVPDSPEALSIKSSKEYGASAAIYKLIRKIGLDQILYSLPEQWVDCVIAMIIGRIIYAGSKLFLSCQGNNSSLWDLCGIDKVDVDRHCYQPMDKLLERQSAIQSKLAKKHLQNGRVVLYDITSTYLEGAYENSSLVKFGYNRDGKRGHEQIVISLICNEDGCPVATEIFPGNTKDSTTVLDVINQLQSSYQIKEAIFVGDRGMITKDNMDTLQADEEVRFITALTRPDVQALVDNNVIQLGLFDRKIGEVPDPNNSKKRYCVCKNPLQAQKDQKTLDALLDKTSEELKKIADYKQATTVEILGARIGKIFKQLHTEQYIHWKVEPSSAEAKSRNHKVVWSLNDDAIQRSKRLAGYYVIVSNVKPNVMSCEELVRSYKSLMQVERAFKNLKTVKLEVRPVYHRFDDRIRAHVFLCMLSYYVWWHMQKRLAPLIQEQTGKDRVWSFDHIIKTLKQITKNCVVMHGCEATKITEPSKDQANILSLLDVSI